MKQSRIRLLVLFFFLFPSLLSATTVTGLVKSAGTASPIAQAQVSALSFVNNDSVIVSAVTNNEGRYSLTVPNGSFIYLTATATGYVTGRIGPIQVDSSVATINFVLQNQILPNQNKVAGAVIRDSLNTPIAGAKVYLGTSQNASMITYTDATGRFSFLNIVPGAYQISAEKDGYYSLLYPKILNVTTTSVIDTIIFKLKPRTSTGQTGSLAGVVRGVGSSGTLVPIAGATLKLSRDSMAAPIVLTTNNLGNYFIASLPTGNYALTIAAAGYVTLNTQLTVFPVGSTYDWVVAQQSSSPSVVSGKVFNDQTSAPLSGASVYLFTANASVPAYNVISDATGKYRFEGVVPGTYKLKAQLAGFQPFTAAQSVTVTPGTVIEGLNIRLVPTDPTVSAKVTGRVIEAGSGGLAVPFAVVKFSGNSSTGVITVPVDSFGNYIVQSIQPGVYVVSASAPRFVTVSRSVTLVSGPNTQNFELRRDTVITGTNLFAGKVLDDSLNTPIRGALVDLIPLNILPYIFPATTDSLGKFNFTNIPPATYVVKVTKSGYVSFTSSEPIVISATSRIENYSVRLVQGTSGGSVNLSGFVVAATGAIIPISNAMVKLYAESIGNFMTFTDSVGKYRFEGIPSGTYTIGVSATGYRSATGTIVLQNGTYTKNFELLPIGPNGTGLVTGKVVFDGTLTPVKGAAIDFIPRSITAGGESFRTVTDSLGKYFAPVRAGSYYVQVKYIRENVGYVYTEYFDNAATVANATPITVSLNDTIRNINFGIPQTPQSNTHFVVITGKVTDTLNRGLANAKVQLYTKGFIAPAVIPTVTTDASGNYALVFQYSSYDTLRKSAAVSASKEGYGIEFFREKPALDFANWLPLLGDTVYTGIDFTLAPNTVALGFTVSGTVKDTLGNALSGVSVIAFGRNSAAQVVFASTGTNGEYTMQLKGGTYLFLFVKEGFTPQFYNNAATWEQATPVILTANRVGIDARLRPLTIIGAGNSMTGIVRTQIGVPVSGVLVGLMNAAGQMVGYDFTGDDGSYQINGITPGSYNMNATHAQYASVQMPVIYDPLMGSSAIVNVSLTQSPTDVNPDPIETAPRDFSLGNFPNPFNPETTIRFTLPFSSTVILKVYDLTGKEVAEVLRSEMQPGEHSVRFNAEKLTSGMYLCELRAGAIVKRSKMLLLK